MGEGRFEFNGELLYLVIGLIAMMVVYLQIEGVVNIIELYIYVGM